MADYAASGFDDVVAKRIELASPLAAIARAVGAGRASEPAVALTQNN